MDKFTVLESVAAPLRIINIDTDMIIPKQYLKTIKRTGLGTGLFSEMRYREDGSENPDFVLNQPAYRKAQILVAGDNFGCGSSREHAVIALKAVGISAIVAVSAARIFFRNAVNLGLPVILCPEAALALREDEAARIALDDMEIAQGGQRWHGLPLGDEVRAILSAGGLVPRVRQALAGRADGPARQQTKKDGSHG
jgi:3-isopropylmalate dehydratase small subunit